MTDNPEEMLHDPKKIEVMALDVIAGDMNYSETEGEPLPKEMSRWAQCATALALHRLANAWERRVEIAEATAKKKGINP